MAGQIQLTLILRQPEAANEISERLLAGTWNPAEMNAADIAANPADVSEVLSFAAKNSLQVLKTNPAARSIRVAGSVPDIENAFGIPSGCLGNLNYKGPVELPAPLNQIVIAVLGLDHSPIAKSHAQ